MKIKEFLSQPVVDYDIFDLHSQFFEHLAKMPPSLFENGSDYEKLVDDLSHFKTDLPEIGREYVYVSVAATPVIKFISVASFGQAFILNQITPSKVIFEINGRLRSFPESGFRDQGDSFSHVFLFNTVNDYKSMLTFLLLRYSGTGENDWKITTKQIL